MLRIHLVQVALCAAADWALDVEMVEARGKRPHIFAQQKAERPVATAR